MLCVITLHVSNTIECLFVGRYLSDPFVVEQCELVIVLLIYYEKERNCSINMANVIPSLSIARFGYERSLI